LALKETSMDSNPDPLRMRGEDSIAGTFGSFNEEIRGSSKDIDSDKVPIIIPAVTIVLMVAPCPMFAILQNTDTEPLPQAVDSH